MTEARGEYETRRAAEAVRFEAQMVRDTTEVILRALKGWNRTARLSENDLRSAMQAAYERIGEVTSG